MQTIQTAVPNLKQVADNWKKWVMLAGFCIIAFFMAPIIYTIIGGMIGIAIAGIVGIITFPLLYVLAVFVANWKIKMLKWAAAQSPVEAMQNVYIARKKNLQEFESRTQELGAGYRTYGSQLKDMKLKWPKKDWSEREAELAQFGKVYNLRLEQVKERRKELDDYADLIEEKGDEWKIGNLAASVQEAAGMSEEDFEQKMVTKAAIDAVTDKINSSYAAMDLALLNDKAPVITLQETGTKQLTS